MTDNMLQTASAWLRKQFKANCSQSVTYKRGLQSVAVSAHLARTDFELTDEDGLIRQAQSSDFIVSAADLVLGGVAITPERGDTIERVVGGKTLTFEVMAPGDEPPWRWTDAHRNGVRVHTKQVR